MKLARTESSVPTALHDPAVRVDADGTIRIQMSKLRPPQNLYDADYAWATRRQGAVVSLFFAKGFPSKKGGGDGTLRSRLELRYPYEPFMNHFWPNSRRFHEGLRAYLADHPLEHEGLDNAPELSADRDHSEWVNFDYLAHSGSQASLDFFHIAPSAIARFVQGQGSRDLEFTPVVRVHTTTFQLCRLLDSCEPIARELEAGMPRSEEL
jgi:hypothetical protein